MKAVVQRVSRARVTVDGETVSEIGPGLLTLLGIEHGDGRKQLEWLITKIVGLRIFDDEAGRMNLSLRDVGGQHLIVSQFTLLADCSKGLRPSFTAAASPDIARILVDEAIAYSQQLGILTAGGRFQAHMNVEILNNGPVTITLETPRSG